MKHHTHPWSPPTVPAAPSAAPFPGHLGRTLHPRGSRRPGLPVFLHTRCRAAVVGTQVGSPQGVQPPACVSPMPCSAASRWWLDVARGGESRHRSTQTPCPLPLCLCPFPLFPCVSLSLSLFPREPGINHRCRLACGPRKLPETFLAGGRHPREAVFGLWG